MSEPSAAPSPPVALAPERQSLAWLWLNRLGPVVLLAVVVVLFGMLIDWYSFLPDGPERHFLTWQNFEKIARQSVIVGLAAMGMTMIMIMGGIDLSVGSMIALGSVVIAAILEARNARGQRYLECFPVLWPLCAGLAGIAACAVCGLVNGLLITGLRVVPFIVTLGMMLEIRGLARFGAHEQKIDAPGSWLDGLSAKAPDGYEWTLLSPSVWLLLIVALLSAGMLRYTRFGRHIFAIGSNEQTARLCGVKVAQVKILVYTLGAACAGLAALVQFSRLTVGDPTTAMGQELDVIAAVVIGGGSLSGGEGSILGSLVGALFLEVVRSGCTQLGLSTYVHMLVTGAIIILAVTLDRLRHRQMEE